MLWSQCRIVEMKNRDDSTLLKLLLSTLTPAPFIEDIEWHLLLAEMDAFSATFGLQKDVTCRSLPGLTRTQQRRTYG